MIRLPKEIAHMIKIIEDAGYEAYAVGGCVRDSVLGRQPEDWDLTSNASRNILEALFPDASVVNKKLGVMRISEGDTTADIAAYRIDGAYKDYRRPETVIFTKDIEEDLRRRDFTMNAIAVSPDRGVVDPYQGREDIRRKLIRGIGDPRLRFEEDALRILRAVRFAAQLGFEIEDGTLQAMKEKVSLLEFISRERILDEFSKTIVAENSGKGLGLMKETGVLPYLFGEECMENAGEGELQKLEGLTGNIDRTKKELDLRLGLVYRCFERHRAFMAIEKLGYSNEMKKKLKLAVSLEEEFDGIGSKRELKVFLCRIGLTDFRYLAALSKEQIVVYRLDDSALQFKRKFYEEIEKRGEPVFLGDLALDGSDLIASGVKEGAEVGRILQLLLDIVHEDPEKNERELLLKIAAENHRKVQF